jgi:hypothetical protein
MRNCLDFGWRSRHLQKNGSLARTCDNGARTCPAPQVVCIFYPLGGRQSGLAVVLARAMRSAAGG